MAPDGEEATFEVSGNTLRVCGELGPDDEEVFSATVYGLMETEHETLVIDVTGVRFIRSNCVHDIVLMMVQARQDGRPVSVRATERVARILSAAGVDKVGTIEVVDEGRTS